MASVIDRNRLSWHSRAEKTAVRPRQFICLQLGYHKTQGASRLLIFCCFFKPSSLHSPGVIHWIENLDETPNNFPERHRRGVPATLGPKIGPQAGLSALRKPSFPTRESVFLELP